YHRDMFSSTFSTHAMYADVPFHIRAMYLKVESLLIPGLLFFFIEYFQSIIFIYPFKLTSGNLTITHLNNKYIQFFFTPFFINIFNRLKIEVNLISFYGTSFIRYDPISIFGYIHDGSKRIYL